MMGEPTHYSYHKVDLRGHCAFCLGKELGQGQGPPGVPGAELVMPGPGGSFNHIWGYLLKAGGGRGRPTEGCRSRYKFVGGGKVLETPPMCGNCGDLIQELEGLHRELMKKVEDIHRIVQETSKERGKYSWRRKELGKVLEDSSLETSMKGNTFQFLENLLESSSRCEPTPVDTDLSTSKDFDIGADGDSDGYIKEEVELDSYSLASGGGLQDDNSGSEFEDDNNDDSDDYDPGDGEDQSCFIDEGDPSGDEDVGRSTLSSPNSKLPGSQKIYSTKKLNPTPTPHHLADDPSHCPSPSISVEEDPYELGGEKTLRNAASDLGDSQLLVKEEVDSPSSENESDFEYQIENEGDTESSETSETSESEEEGESSESDHEHKEKVTIKEKKSKRQLSKPQTQFCDLCHQRIPFQEIRQHLEAHNVTDYISNCPHPDCPYTFSNRRSLEALHLFDRWNRFLKCRKFLNPSNKNKRSYWFLECETCGHKSKDCNALRDHINKSHESESTWKYPCPIQGCPKQFSVKQRLEYHLKGHDVREEVLQRCSLCKWGGKFRDKKDMAEHLKKVHKVKGIIECKQCPFLFPSRKDLLEHMRNHQKEGIICDLCENHKVKFSIYGEFKQHYYDEHKIGKEFVCRDCGKGYTSKDGFRGHIKAKKHHQNHHQKFKCKYCHQSFPEEENLRPHVILCHPEMEGGEANSKWPTKESEDDIGLEKGVMDDTNEGEESSSDEEKATKSSTRRMVPDAETDNLSISDQPCDLCRQQIPFLEMRRHLEAHNVADYICECPNPDCPYIFSNRRSLEAFHLFHLRNRFLECRKFLNLPKNQNTYWFLKCETCGDVSKDYTSLRIHITKFHESKPTWKFPCPIKDCPKQFSVKQSVEYHLRRHDLRDQVIQTCPMCRRSLRHRTKKEMTDHLHQVHKVDEIIECKQCPFIFSSREGLLAHMKQHQEEGISCDICDDGVKFDTYGKFRLHYFSAHQIGLEFVCQDCGTAYDTSKRLESHVRQHQPPQPRKRKLKATPVAAPRLEEPEELFKCDACPEDPKSYKSEAMLYTHKIKVHGAEALKCQFCEATFVIKFKLDKHEKLHAGSREFKCEFENCGKSFTKRISYLHHIAYHRNGKLMCDTCGKEFYGKEGLQQHINSVHLGLKKFVCEVCGTHLATLYSLIIHRRRHTGERPYSCSNCNETFGDRSRLKQHLRYRHRPDSHLPVVDSSSSGPKRKRKRAPRRPRPDNDPNWKSVVCETCGNRFVSNGNLRLHQKTAHSNTPKPSFPCHICGDKLSSEMSLEQHKRIHSGERPFQCHLCPSNQAFRTVGAFNAHLRRHERKGERFRPRGPIENFPRRKRPSEPSPEVTSATSNNSQ